MKKQDGFTVVEVLLTLLLVSFISFAGYYVWNSQKHTTEDKKSNGASNKSAVASGSKPVDIASSWLKYTTSDRVYGVNLPDGYDFEKSDDGSLIMALEEKMVYQKGTKATLNELLGRGAVVGLFVNFDAQSNMSDGATPMKDFSTKSGVQVSEYYQLYSEDSEGIGPSKGTKEYIFIAYKGSKKVEVRYTSLNPSQLDTVEQMVKTISIQ
jgi:hypothetical protein